MTRQRLAVSRTETFAEAYGRLHPSLLRVVYLLTYDTSEAFDIVQDCFAEAYQRWDELDHPESYLRRSAVIKHERQTRERNLSPRAPEYLADLIAALPPKERAVVVLRFYLDLKTTEIADALGMRPGSVGPTLTSALRRLERAIDQ